MPFTDKGTSEDVESLVDTLSIEGAPNLTQLSTTDFHQLAQLSQDLHLTTGMETDETEVIIETMEEGDVEEEVIHEEIGAHEIEIETERVPSPDEILPDIKTSSTCKPTGSSTNVPPLRPLTIAPKPTKIAMKPITGQQLFLLQGTSPGQAIKLVSTQGQELNLANLSLSRTMALKPSTTVKTTQLVPQKVVMKKIVQPIGQQQQKTKPLTTFTNNKGQIVVVQKPTNQSPTKTITLQQAQEMGLITSTTTTTSGKLIQPQAQSTPKHGILINKQQTQSKTIKIIPQNKIITTGGNNNTQKNVLSPIKSPTKILPATAPTNAGTNNNSKIQQRIIFKSGTGGQATTILPSAQIIQVAGTQAINAGQLHQINIPGKGMQYIKFVPATNADSLTTTTTTKVNTQSTLTSPTNIILSEVKTTPTTTVTNIAPKPLRTIAFKSPSNNNNNMVIVPNYLQTTKVAIPMRHSFPKQVQQQQQQQKSPTMPETNQDSNLETNGIRPRKPCNCTKSQCLKLYCDCFANGEFCYMCNCMNCYNNLENEDHRQRAIKTCLERNPTAFRPKIGKAKDMGDNSIRKHTKGCNCKRSGCLKNYCECYEAKIACSNNCKCVGCRNIEDSMDKKGICNTLDDLPIMLNQNYQNQVNMSKMKDSNNQQLNRLRRNSNTRQPINFINDDVIEATTQCMLTISDYGEVNQQDEELTKRQIIEEFGRCLTEIINYSTAHN